MGGRRLQLFLASFLMLFVELVLIRWASSYVVYLSYFTNFVLLGSFLGIGVGFLRAHRGPDLFRWSPLVLALFLGFVMAFPVTIDRTGGDLVFFGSLTNEGLPVWIMLPVVFLAAAATMATIGHGVATRFQAFEPLEAYRLDILGSLAGIGAYVVLSLLGTPPLAWGLVMAGLFGALLLPRHALHLLAVVPVVAVLEIGTFSPNTIWSPYYRILVNITPDERPDISVNGIPHQAAVHTAGSPYEVPYAHVGTDNPLRDVLVIGAGNGNDVAAALAAGAGHVDAVEIDPEIQAIGVEAHPDHPYQDQRVTRIVNDGRAVLQSTDRTYDLIVFALPDSLTLVSGQSGVRLESYLFTREAFEAARDRLNPGGAFAMYNFYREQWLQDRLAGTLADVFGRAPCLDTEGRGTIVGSLSMFVVGTTDDAQRCDAMWDPQGREVVGPATDDRPFVYLRDPSIPSRYLWSLALVLLTSLVLVRSFGGRMRAMSGAVDLFLMGAAFLLIETKNVTQFALLFGTTWLVNALVFAGILLTVLAAVEVERRVRIGRPKLLFGALFLALAVAAAVPAAWLLDLSAIPRFLTATAIAFTPVFVANLVFAERFRDAPDPTAAFGANLLGAMLGGALEYLALITGYRSLLGLATALYVLAWVFGRRRVRPTALTADPSPAAPRVPAIAD